SGSCIAHPVKERRLCIFAALRPGLLSLCVQNLTQPLRGDPCLLLRATVCRWGDMLPQDAVQEPTDETIAFSRIKAPQGGQHRAFVVFHCFTGFEEDINPPAALAIGCRSA